MYAVAHCRRRKGVSVRFPTQPDLTGTVWKSVVSCIVGRANSTMQVMCLSLEVPRFRCTQYHLRMWRLYDIIGWCCYLLQIDIPLFGYSVGARISLAGVVTPS
ncbi:hypothetical protein PILCRDRAFT_819512 [Piloderma croceum F 1598]|uniref:Uncharacterized protein n=1 Tax=Piloderma croceum (strain F 1598) TaxID=765440 RepID=A0A0C3BAF3_PILCF|nr:hypothetical protein PILCRDRAFT_819512 [Piloderma croceum F 1598]